MIEARRKKSEEESNKDKKSWKEANDCSKRRIVELEDENIRLTKEAAQKEKLSDVLEFRVMLWLKLRRVWPVRSCT